MEITNTHLNFITIKKLVSALVFNNKTTNKISHEVHYFDFLNTKMPYRGDNLIGRWKIKEQKVKETPFEAHGL